MAAGVGCTDGTGCRVGWQALAALAALTALTALAALAALTALAALAVQKLTFRPLPIKPHVFFIGKG